MLRPRHIVRAHVPSCNNTHILVVTSSYPRFADDTLAPFVARSVETLQQVNGIVDVLAPDHADTYPQRKHVHLARYAADKSTQTLCYGDGILSNIRQRPLRALLIPSLMAAFHRYLRTSHHDAVIAHWLMPAALCAVGAGCSKVVAIAHGSDISLLERLPLGSAIARCLQARCHAIFFVSADLQRRFEYLCQQSCGQVLPPAIPMRKRLSRRQARRDLHIKTNAKVVLFLGRLQDNKGVQLLLKALPQQAIALIAGNGPLLDKLQEHAQQLGVNARFEGAVPPSRHATLFAAADVLAIPSFADVHGHAEGLPSVMLEAFAHGVPVVASHIGGIPEVLQHEQHGLLVRPGSVDDLRQALLRMLNDQRLQQRCRRAISALAQRYTPRAQAELLLRLCTSQHR